jgi:hypothetical protein
MKLGNIGKDKRNIVIIILALLFLIKVPQGGLRYLLWVLTAVLSSAFSDFLISKIFYKHTISPKSAIITGLIIGGILDFSASWLFLIIFSFLAILSKHILKFRKSHIFNPANFALFMASLFKVPLVWNIESNIYLIILAGLYLAYSFKKFPQIIGFLFFFSPLFFFIGKINPFRIISWFFIFVMLIEPKTSGYGVLKGFVFGAIAGIFSFLIFKCLPQIDFYVGSLFSANLLNPFLGKILKK